MWRAAAAVEPKKSYKVRFPSRGRGCRSLSELFHLQIDVYALFIARPIAARHLQAPLTSRRHCTAPPERLNCRLFAAVGKIQMFAGKRSVCVLVLFVYDCFEIRSSDGAINEFLCLYDGWTIDYVLVVEVKCSCELRKWSWVIVSVRMWEELVWFLSYRSGQSSSLS